MYVEYHYELSQYKLHQWLLLFIECSTHVATKSRTALWSLIINITSHEAELCVTAVQAWDYLADPVF